MLELSVQQELVYRPHIYEKHESCERNACSICDGGLAHCTACGGFEGSLLDTCPGVQLTIAQHDWNLSEMQRELAAYRYGKGQYGGRR